MSATSSRLSSRPRTSETSTRATSTRSSTSATGSPVSSSAPSAAGALPLVLGGDHSVALGSLVGMAKARGAGGGVVWVDAHGDVNTPETSPSGNVHGMVLAAALGLAGEKFARDELAAPSSRLPKARARRCPLAR